MDQNNYSKLTYKINLYMIFYHNTKNKEIKTINTYYVNYALNSLIR